MAAMGKRLATAAVMAILAVGACASDANETVSAGSDGPDAPVDQAGIGVVTVQLEPVDGVFIEGFEVGLRFETVHGDVLGSTLWTDFINEQFIDPTMDDYYDGVVRQEVPAGPVVVLATINIGAGPPPEIPDLAGDLRCRLSVDVPTGGEVAVEVNFDGGDDCLRHNAVPSPPIGASCGSFDVDEAHRTDPGPLVAAYACLRDAFETGETVSLQLVFTDGDGNRVPTSFTADDGRIVVVRQLPTGEEREVCSRLTGDHDGTVYPEDCLREDSPSDDDVVTATAEDDALIQSFLNFAKDPTAGTAAKVPFADEVALGLASQIHANVAHTHIADEALWSIDVEYFRAYAGPFSALDVAADSGEVVVLLGEHPHCASPPVPPPAELAELRRVSVQPAPGPIDSCIQWWTIDLFVTPDGEVVAVTLDLWEP